MSNDERFEPQPLTAEEIKKIKEDAMTNLATLFGTGAALAGLTIGETVQVHLKCMVDLAVMDKQGNVRAAVNSLSEYTNMVFKKILEEHGKPKLYVPN